MGNFCRDMHAVTLMADLLGFSAAIQNESAHAATWPPVFGYYNMQQSMCIYNSIGVYVVDRAGHLHACTFNCSLLVYLTLVYFSNPPGSLQDSATCSPALSLLSISMLLMSRASLLPPPARMHEYGVQGPYGDIRHNSPHALSFFTWLSTVH